MIHVAAPPWFAPGFKIRFIRIYLDLPEFQLNLLTAMLSLVMVDQFASTIDGSDGLFVELAPTVSTDIDTNIFQLFGDTSFQKFCDNLYNAGVVVGVQARVLPLPKTADWGDWSVAGAATGGAAVGAIAVGFDCGGTGLSDY